ncbi:MAG: hypothetical protein RBR38_06890 [Desulfomicrobium apsheronum]|nr:hypothetical protein [Desulfomicrobium apsheronum]
MKRLIFAILLGFLCTGTAMASGLDIFLEELDAEATRSRSSFVNNLSARYGVPTREVEDLARMTKRPADIFMIFELARMTGLTRERVRNTYEKGEGKGWGVMAQEMGIKPGSKEFHALKNGEFDYWGSRSKKGKGYDDDSMNSGKGKGKGYDDSVGSGKGKSKGKGYDDDLLPEDHRGSKGEGKGKKK